MEEAVGRELLFLFKINVFVCQAGRHLYIPHAAFPLDVSREAF